MPELDRVKEFLAQKRIAFVGVSRDERDFSRALFRELIKQGYDVLPVNPHADVIEGMSCFAKVSEIKPPVENVLLMTAPNLTESVVQDCIKAGVKRIWMHKGVGRGSVHPDAVKLCLEHNIALVEGQCPYMFLPRPGFYHRLHEYGKKLAGSYPN